MLDLSNACLFKRSFFLQFYLFYYFKMRINKSGFKKEFLKHAELFEFSSWRNVTLSNSPTPKWFFRIQNCYKIYSSFKIDFLVEILIIKRWVGKDQSALWWRFPQIRVQWAFKILSPLTRLHWTLTERNQFETNIFFLDEFHFRSFKPISIALPFVACWAI